MCKTHVQHPHTWIIDLDYWPRGVDIESKLSISTTSWPTISHSHHELMCKRLLKDVPSFKPLGINSCCSHWCHDVCNTLVCNKLHTMCWHIIDINLLTPWVHVQDIEWCSITHVLACTHVLSTCTPLIDVCRSYHMMFHHVSSWHINEQWAQSLVDKRLQATSYNRLLAWTCVQHLIANKLAIGVGTCSYQ